MTPAGEPHECAFKEEALQLRQRLAEVEARLRELEASRKAADAKKRKEATPGGKSERQPPKSPKPETKKPQTGHGPTEQPALPVVEEPVQKLDAADCTCPKCGDRLDEWEGQFEESEEIDVVVKGYVRKKKRAQKYRCCTCKHIESPLAPPRVLPGGRYSNAFALQVLVEKYLDHMPLDRQTRSMARQGLVVKSQVLWDQQWAMTRLLAPAGERLKAYALASGVLGVDETRWPFLGENPRNWTMWCATANGVVYFEILDGRGSAQGEMLLRGFKGILMVDGYAVYEWLAKNYPGITLAFCWAHVRRHAKDVETAFPVEVEKFVALIGRLFEIEKRATSREHRLQLRQAESKAVVEDIRSFITNTPALPNSGLRRAFDYVAKRWTGLTRFLDNPDIPLTNNQAERGQRGPVLGRNNHQGSHSDRGVESAALFYSLFESAKLCGINPEAYLRHAMAEALARRQIPLPHEVADRADLRLPNSA